VRPDRPSDGKRLDLIATLRAAAPWQHTRPPTTRARVQIRAADFRIRRYAERNETLTIFAVDASGSQALHRLAEAKGAVETLLADCYIRRDQVALIGFRGACASILLPPTRSLPRAKRCLAGLPGGGGTPLALGIDAASTLADAARRRGQTPLIVLLTDGRANIDRHGKPDRATAHEHAMASARAARRLGCTALLIDTGPQADPRTGELAAAMGATHIALPYLDAGRMTAVVKATQAAHG
jgi:magnesium chelatase subunit D